MFGAMLGALAGGALNLIGGNQANAANAKMAANQMAFQQGQMDQSQDFSREMVGRQEQFQTNSAKTAMDFSERMAGTAYQRGMADMKEAGLNPILAYGQGGATSPQGPAPGGASASVGMGGGASATMQNVLGPALGSAIQGSRVITELEQLAANVKQTEAATQLTTSQQAESQANTGLQIARAVTEGVRPEQIRAGIRLAGAQTAREHASAQRIGVETDQAREELHDYRNWGPPGPLRNPAVTGERAGQRIGRNLPQGRVEVEVLPDGQRAPNSMWERLRNLLR